MVNADHGSASSKFGKKARVLCMNSFPVATAEKMPMSQNANSLDKQRKRDRFEIFAVTGIETLNKRKQSSGRSKQIIRDQNNVLFVE